jgi:hypothetical protein
MLIEVPLFPYNSSNANYSWKRGQDSLSAIRKKKWIWDKLISDGFNATVIQLVVQVQVVSQFDMTKAGWTEMPT